MRKMPKVFLKRVVQKISLKKLIFLHQKIIFNKNKNANNYFMYNSYNKYIKYSL